MSMTREEAIKILQHLAEIISSGDYQETFKMAVSALRPVSREKVEKAWRGCPECKQRCGLCVNMEGWDRHGKPYVCEQCVDYSNFESDQRFCEVCGRPMTDEAVQMVMERLEALNEV